MDPTIPPGARCVQCQWPLPQGTFGPVVCPVCGRSNMVDAAPYRPPPRSSAAPIVAFFIGVGVLSILLSVAFALSFLRHRPTRGPQGDLDDDRPTLPTFGSPSNASDIVSWVGSGGSHPICLADLDGDESLDVVGYGAGPSGIVLMGVSARSGKILWQSREYSDSTRPVLCNGRAGIVILSPKDFTVRAVSPKDGKSLWTTKLSDAPDQVSFGDGCLVVLATDGSSYSLSQSTGRNAACPAAPRPRPLWQMKDDPVRFGNSVISFSTVPRGTPRVVVTATTGTTKTWEQTLALAVDSSIHAPAHALVSQGLLVAGQRPGTQNMVVVLIDPASGRVQREREIEQKENHGSFFSHLMASRTHVFFECFGKLYALRLPALDVAWSAGSMWK